MLKTSEKWSEERLSGYRYETDPVADITVKELIEQESPDKIHEIYRHLVQNEDVKMVRMPEKIQAYFDQTAGLPSWHDSDLCKKGAEVFGLYGPELSMLLLCKSLPASYACRKGAQVLYQTGRLQEHGKNLKIFQRRLMETSQFVINAMSLGGLGKRGNAIISAQKVRLMHASIRYFIKQKGGWNTEELGEPINQEDMAGTLMAFAAYPIEGLAQIGISLTTEEQDAYMHLWSCIGHIMGVKHELIPLTFKEGQLLGKLILDQQKGESEAGKELTRACIDFMKEITPGNRFDFYPEMLMNYLLGDEISSYIGVKEYSKLTDRTLEFLFSEIFQQVDEKLDEHARMRVIARVFNRRLLQGMIDYFNHDKQVSFYVPPSLRESWMQEPLNREWESIVSLLTLGRYRLSIDKQKT